MARPFCLVCLFLLMQITACGKDRDKLKRLRWWFGFLLIVVFLLFVMRMAYQAGEDWGQYRLAAIEELPASAELPSLDGEMAEGRARRVAALMSKAFVPMQDGMMRMASFNGERWFRIPVAQFVQNGGGPFLRRSQVAMLSTVQVTRVECFVPDPVASDRLMLWASWSGRPLEGIGAVRSTHPVFLMPCFFDARPGRYVYLRIRNTLPLNAYLHILDQDQFMARQMEAFSFHTLFICSLLGFILAYLLFYLSTGSPFYRSAIVGQVAFFFFILFFNRYPGLYFDLPMSLTYFLTWLFYGVLNVVWSMLNHAVFYSLGGRDRGGSPMTGAQVLLGLFVTLLSQTDRPDLLLTAILLAFLVNVAGFLNLAFHMYRMGRRDFYLLTFITVNLAFILSFMGLFCYTFLSLGGAFFMGMVSMVLFLILLLGVTCIPLYETRTRFHDYTRLQAQSSYYRELSQRDAMTGLYNHAFLKYSLAERIANARSMNRPLSFIMMDIDHFKAFNDTWGHQEGDGALILIAEILKGSLREYDIAARYGREEFCAVLDGASMMTAVAIAERIRSTCEFRSRSLGEGKQVTISLGVAELNREDTPETLVERADNALYTAKRNGRNRVEHASAPGKA